MIYIHTVILLYLLSRLSWSQGNYGWTQLRHSAIPSPLWRVRVVTWLLFLMYSALNTVRLARGMKERYQWPEFTLRFSRRSVVHCWSRLCYCQRCFLCPLSWFNPSIHFVMVWSFAWSCCISVIIFSPVLTLNPENLPYCTYLRVLSESFPMNTKMTG